MTQARSGRDRPLCRQSHLSNMWLLFRTPDPTYTTHEACIADDDDDARASNPAHNGMRLTPPPTTPCTVYPKRMAIVTIKY